MPAEWDLASCLILIYSMRQLLWFDLTVHSVVEDERAWHCSSEAAGDTHGPIISR